MGDIIELSSDSDDTIIQNNDAIPGPSKDIDYDNLENEAPLMKRVCKEQEKSDDLHTLNQLLNKYKEYNKNDDIVEISTNIGENSLSSKEKARLEKEKRKEERLKLRQERREAVQTEKAIKQALATTNRNLKPDECLKFVIVNLDENLKNEKYFDGISTTLKTSGISYKLKQQLISHVITWTRIVQSHLLNDNGQLSVSSTESDTKELLLIINGKNFVEFVTKNSLHEHIQILQSMYSDKRLFLVIFGLKKCTRSIPKNTIESMLAELQLFYSCSHRFLETDDDLAQIIFQFTKSIAQIPFKEKKRELQDKTNFYAAGDNRNCVKIDSNGNGLARLWNQMLVQFPLASLETAEAISLQYPTLSSLMEAYESCTTEKDGQELLQDLQIRRAAGPLTSNRKIGREFSRKIHNFYTSTNGENLL